MKIRDDQPAKNGNLQDRPPDDHKAVKITETGIQKDSTDTDRITLSPRARMFRAACRRLAESPDMRPEKVAEIKARVNSGRYRIKAERIAARMIRDALAADE